MPNFRTLASSAYLVAFLLIAIPVFDASATVAPWAPMTSQWRFGALGLLANAMMIPASGALIAIVTATMNDHTKALKWLGRLAWLVATFCLFAIIVFALDAVQASPQINPALMLSYKVSVMTATVKWFLGAVTFAVFGIACGIPAPTEKTSPAAPRP